MSVDALELTERGESLQKIPGNEPEGQGTRTQPEPFDVISPTKSPRRCYVSSGFEHPRIPSGQDIRKSFKEEMDT